MIRIDENTYIDNSLITHAEFQLFLDEMRAEGKYYQPDHWQTFTFPPGQGRMPVTGVRPTAAVAFCHWLTQRSPNEWGYRLPDADELQNNNQTASSLGNNPIGYWATKGNQTDFFWLATGVANQKKSVLKILFTLDRARALIPLIKTDKALDLDQTWHHIFSTKDRQNRYQDQKFSLLAENKLDLPPKERQESRDFLRLLLLNSYFDFESQLESLESNQSWLQFRQDTEKKQKMAELNQKKAHWAGLYNDLLMLEARIQEKLPAYESILIVKERKEPI